MPTRFMTNSVYIADRLNRKCVNLRNKELTHRHVVLMNGRARAAQVYPHALCKAIREGLIEQKKAEEEGKYLIASI